MSDASTDESFVRRYLEIRSTGLREETPGIFLATIPETLRPAFEGAIALRIAFDPAVAASAPNVEIAVVGSYLMDRIIEDAVREGLHGVARIEARSAPPESILAQSFRPRNATLNVDATQTTSVPHILFNFRVRLTTDERIERLESVLIDTRSASERHTAPIVFGEGVQVSANGIAAVQEVEAHYRAACRALEARIEADVGTFQGQAHTLLEEDRRRIKEYFDRSIHELSESKAGNAQDEMRALELERKRRLEESEEKYRFVGEIELCNVRTVLLDVTAASLAISHRGARKVLSIEYDPLGNGLEPVACEVCGARTPEPVLCFGGHLAGEECVQGCVFCDQVHCQQCISTKGAIATCGACGRGVCPDHVEVDALSRRPYCPDHIHSCAICSRTVGPEYVRTCRTCEQAYCAVCVSAPSDQCLTCRSLDIAGIDDPSVAAVQGLDPALARVARWRRGSNHRYTIVVAKGLIWSQLFVLAAQGAVLVRKKVLGI